VNQPTFTEIPTLRQLIKNDGKPGVEYAIVEVANLFRAQSEGWDDLDMRTRAFRLQGPQGTADCKLLGKGKPIPGQQMGSVSPLHIDTSVKQKTGLGIKEAPPERMPIQNTPPTPKK
jgi:hypothetical protein